MMIRTIIIDDEPSAVNVLALLLKKRCKDDVEVIATSTSPFEGKKLIEQHQPDLVFLDIEMPGMTGVDLLRSFNNPSFRVIFVTAFDAYAVEAFRLSAVDYLLKPFSFERFLKAVNKVIEKLNNSSLPKKEEIDAFIFFKSDKKIHKVDLESIQYIEAVGDYMKVITDSGQLLINETMKNLQEELPDRAFIRVHKSFIISRNRIKFIEGNYIQVENKSIPIGATYRNDVLASTDKKS